MTDTNTSGASFAPVADNKAPAATAETAAGNFGSTRGSGLARGKRSTSAAAPAAADTVKGDYKPTALEIITPEREYKNPFASPEPVSVPASEPAKVESPAAPAIASVEPELERSTVEEALPEPVAERREIQILPPAESVRPSVSWESPSASRRDQPQEDRPQRDERPTFRPDRREDSAPQAEGAEARSDGRYPRRDSFQRQPRDPRDARQPRDPREARQPRDPREARQPRDPRDYPDYDPRPRNPAARGPAPAAPAPTGFLAWVKRLLGIGPKPEPTPVGRDLASETSHDGQRNRRRHRGGRGHGGQGPRGDRSQQGGQRSPQGGDPENSWGDRQGGHRRRRHRGGQGRDRGDDSNAQGHQGGGAI